MSYSSPLAESTRCVRAARVKTSSVSPAERACAGAPAWRDFTPDECDFMLGVANISAIAIENARMHEATRLNYELLTSYNYQVFED